MHDLAVDEISYRTARLNFPVAETLRRIMMNGRLLDRGNPGPDSQGRDFGQIGRDFWPDLNRRYPSKAPKAMMHTTIPEHIARVFGGTPPW